MGFPRQEYWSGLPFPTREDLLDPGIEPRSPAWQTDALPSEPRGKTFGETGKKWGRWAKNCGTPCSKLYNNMESGEGFHNS